MRLKVARLRRVIKRDLKIEFGNERLSSYGGLELLGRFMRVLRIRARIRASLSQCRVDSDYGSANLVLLIVGLLAVGARRLGQLRYLADDLLVARLCGLARIPSDRTVVNWLKQFTRHSLRRLIGLNLELVCEQVEQLALPRLTIDLDGTVIRTGPQVGWAQYGYQSQHHRKRPGYYPLLAHLAQTGQILKLKNRPGNIHDSKGADAFLRELLRELRARWGRTRQLEFRMDSAFFQGKILRLLEADGCGYVIKAAFNQWTGLKALVAAHAHWTPVTPQVSCFETQIQTKRWGFAVRVVVYRKRVHHLSPRNFQLDLFSPDDGYFEYSAVASNLALAPRALWHFSCGRGAQEKSFAELKGEFALDAVPTNHYGANSAWMQLSVLAHNLLRSFQLHCALAPARPRSLKRTYRYRILSMKTLRFLLINRAARIARIKGRNVLRFSLNPSSQSLFNQVAQRLAA